MVAENRLAFASYDCENGIQQTKRNEMRRKLLIGGIVIALVGASLFVMALLRHPHFEKWLSPPQAKLPEDPEIESMQAIIYKTVGLEQIDEFDVPPELIPRILYWFRQSKHLGYSPVPSDLLGKLKIKTKEGEIRTFTFYDFGANPIVFTENNVDFYRGGRTVEPTNIEGVKPCGGLGYCGIVVVGRAIKDAHSKSTQTMKE